MNMTAASVYDSKAKTFSPPMFFRTAAEAVRSFGSAVQDKTGAIGQYPADYSLVQVGTFDDETAELHPVAPIRILTTGNDFIQTGKPVTDGAQLGLIKEA